MRRLEFTEAAKEELSRLEKTTAQQVFSKLRWLAVNFDPLTPESLAGDLRGFYKLRIGDFRALYTFDKTKIVVHFVRHRREVYKTK